MRLLREKCLGILRWNISVFMEKGSNAFTKRSKKTTGMLLTTGPTGSGKTTTLYTILDIINTPEVNISTIEDPIEYQMKRINHAGEAGNRFFFFPDGLRHSPASRILISSWSVKFETNETASLAIIPL